MSTFDAGFKVKLNVGDQIIPLASEIVISSEAGSGVSDGFIFKLDRLPSAPPVTISLGAIISFIENQLGGPNMSQDQQQMSGITAIFPSLTSSNFDGQNETLVNIYEFSVNSTKKEFLFSINIDIQGSDPSQGLISLPSELASWLKIENLSIAFSATSKS